MDTIGSIVTNGLGVITSVLTFVKEEPLLIGTAIIGIAGYALAVAKGAIR